MNEYFQIKYTAEPLTKPYTKSYGHVFYHNNCFLNKQIESKFYPTIWHSLPLCLTFNPYFTLGQKFTITIGKTNLQKFRSPLIILFHFFYSMFHAIFTLNIKNRTFREKIPCTLLKQEMHFLKLNAATTTKYKRFFKLYPSFPIILLIKNLVFTNMLFSHSIYLHKQKFSSYKIFT